LSLSFLGAGAAGAGVEVSRSFTRVFNSEVHVPPESFNALFIDA
jgi:hypothetical protein